MDSAILNAAERIAFHSNISGCREFKYDQILGMSVKWFVLRKLFVEEATFSAELQADEVAYLPQLLAQVRLLTFQKSSFRHEGGFKLQTAWLGSKFLVQLSFEVCGVEDLSALSVCRNLMCLQLQECAHISSDSFVVGIKGCTGLNYFFLSGCATLRENAMIALFQSCTQLNDVHFNGQCDFSEVFANVTSTASIWSFSCTDQHTVFTGSALRGLAATMPNIYSLRLYHSSNAVRDADIDVLFRSCRSLTSLHMFNYTLITNAAFISNGPYLSHLEYVDIEYCWSIMDAGIITLAQYSTNLSSLCLTELNITDAAIQAVGTHCRLLDDLSVPNCASLTDSAFATLNIAQIRNLNVTGTRITGTFASRVLSDASALRMLTGLECEQLNASFVHSLPICNTRLSSLRLGSVHQLTESDWLQLSTKLPNLHSLYICDAPAVNDTIAQGFKINCPNLTHVMMKDCNVSEGVLKLFAKIFM